jgi:DNA polymerase-3 subunit delta
VPTVTPATVHKHIESGRLAPVYLVVGDDDVGRADLAAAFAESVEEDLRAFNVERMYGGEVTVDAMLDALRTLPMMAPRRVVVVLQAERLLIPRKETQQSERDQDALGKFFIQPFAHATLVLVAAALDSRRRVTRLLLEHAVVVNCAGLEGEDDARRWIRRRAEEEGVAIEPKGIELLARRSGGDIGRLRADFERLLLYTFGSKSIVLAEVRDILGGEVSLDDWAVTNAIQNRQPAVALKEVVLILDSGEEPVKILGQLGWFVRTKMRSSRVRDAVDAIFRTDLALKTSGGDPRVLFERLVVELCDCQSR